MFRGKYLKLVGILEIVCSVIGIVIGFIFMIAASIGASWASSAFGGNGLSGIMLFFAWVVFLASCFFAPALGVLFFTVGDMLENPKMYQNIHDNEIRDNKIKDLQSSVSILKQTIKDMKNKIATLEDEQE